MFTLETRAHVAGLSARAAYDFVVVPLDGDFQAWWPGTHLKSKLLRRGSEAEADLHVGTRIYLEQMIGRFHVRETAEIVQVTPGRRFVRQIIAGIKLPVFITFELEDVADGTLITHTIEVGYHGLGRILDPLFRLFFFTPAFVAALDEHLRDEFKLLCDVTTGAATTGVATTTPSTGER